MYLQRLREWKCLCKAHTESFLTNSFSGNHSQCDMPPDRARASLQERPGVLHNPWGPHCGFPFLSSAWSPDVLNQEVTRRQSLCQQTEEKMRCTVRSCHQALEGAPGKQEGEQRAMGPLEPPQLLSHLGSRIYLGYVP